MNNKIRVEINVNDKWESSYSMRRIDMDKVYKYMDLLLLGETEEFDTTEIDQAINAGHELSGL